MEWMGEGFDWRKGRPALEINRSTVLVTTGAGLAGSYAAKYGEMEKRGALAADMFVFISRVFEPIISHT